MTHRADAPLAGFVVEHVRKLPPWLASLCIHGLVALALCVGPFALLVEGGGHVFAPELLLHRSDGEDAPASKVLMNFSPPPTVEEEGEREEALREEEPTPEEEAQQERQLETEIDRDDRAATNCVSDAPFQGNFWNSAIGIGDGRHGDAFGARFGGRRNLRAQGGGRRTESAVLMGLAWLKRSQNPDGLWSSDGDPARTGTAMRPAADPPPNQDVACSALALLAFLGAGHCHRHGRFKETVKRGLRTLAWYQDREGRFCRETPDGRWLVDHAVATTALAEAYGMSNGSPLLADAAQKGVNLLMERRNADGGWGSVGVNGAIDGFATAWAVLALKAAEEAGLDVPEHVLAEVAAWVRNSAVAGKVGTANRPKAFLSALALASVLRGEGLIPENESFVDAAANALAAHPPRWRSGGGCADTEYWFFGTTAQFLVAGDRWKAWNESLKDALIPNQNREAGLNGSWDPAGPPGFHRSRVYATALACLTLEVYYRVPRSAR